MFNNLFDKTITLLGKALDLRSTRHNMILSNVANQDTPGYKTKDIDFRNELKSAFDDMNSSKIIRTDPGHMSGTSYNINLDRVDISTRKGNSQGIDRNSVNIEEEMSKLAENTISYNTYAQILSGKIRLLKSAIRGQ